MGIACTDFCVGPVGGGSLDPEGLHSALGWNDLGGYSNLGQNDWGTLYSGGHYTQGGGGGGTLYSGGHSTPTPSSTMA